MPRQARRKSESGIYHIMLRGINQQQIFEDREDYEKFLQILKDLQPDSFIGIISNTNESGIYFRIDLKANQLKMMHIL